MSNHAQPLLRGRIIFALRRGHYPPSDVIRELMLQYPDTVIRTETIYQPYTTFVVTAQPKH